MNMGMRIWLIVATLLVVAGLALFAVAMGRNNWNFTKLGTGEYETNTYELRQSFSSISIDTDTADIVFVRSRDGKTRVECYEEANAKHSVAVEGDTLVIGMINQKSWYNYIGVNFETSKITVYLPGEAYAALSVREDTGDITVPESFDFEEADLSLSTGDVRFGASVSRVLKIRTSTGYITVEGTSAGALDLAASTGRITVTNVDCRGDVKLSVSTGKNILENVTCQNLISEGDTGDLVLTNVVAAGTLTVTRSTGDVHFEMSDAAEIFVQTDTGDVTGTICSAKVFSTETDTGSVRVPQSVTGGICRVTTDTGSIKLDIA